MILDKTLFNLGRQLHMFPQSRFGAIRKHDIHAGVDIYCADGEAVMIAEPGEVVAIEQFTGEAVGSPWWNDTWATTIKTPDNRYMVYGEIWPLPSIKVGDNLPLGARIGGVIPVLKTNKGVNPVSMLHFEMYTEQPTSIVWNLNDPQPANLIDPTEYLLKLFSKGYTWENQQQELTRTYSSAYQSK